MWNWKLSFVREERIERKERERGGGRVSISSRWSYWSMGARARTSIHTWIHGNSPSWSMLVMVNYHVSRTPTSPSSLCSFDSLSQICTVKLFWLLHSDLQSPCPISLSSSFSFPSLHSWIIHFSPRFFCSRASLWLRYRANCTIFHRREGKIESIFVDLLLFSSKSSQTRNTWHFCRNWNFIYTKCPVGSKG